MKLDIMKLNKKNIINFEVDYIELFWTLKNYKEIEKGLDSDNSNFRVFKWYTLEKSDNIQNYQYKITFWKKEVPVFAWYLWDQLNLYIETKDYFCVYGSAFTLMNLNEIIDFINENLFIDFWSQNYIKEINKKMNEKREEKFILKRVDLAIDIIKPIDKVVKNFRKLQSKWSKFFDENWNIQTYYIWEKKNTLNKNLLIRIYDKIADIKQKEKQFLHPHYLKEKYVTRIELEFRSELVKFLYLEKLLDRNYIFSLFTSYIQKHTCIFENIKWKDIRLKKLIKSITVQDLHSRQLAKQRYLNTFLWYSRKFLELWTCPVHILIKEWIIADFTKRDIWLSIVDWILDMKKYREWLTTKNIKYLFTNNQENDKEGN